jgi:polyisoprenoid-binding protein YceI
VNGGVGRPVGAASRAGVSLLGAVLIIGATNVLGAGPGPWRVVRGEVRVLCPMTIGGSFEAKTKSLTGTVTLAASHPVLLAGDLTVDLEDLDTGIDLRNEHLRNTYLEVSKDAAYERAVLSEVKLGDVEPEAFQGRTAFSGVFTLHGVKKTVTGQADIRREGASVRVEASFPVTIADYAIAKPRYLGVGVKDEVQVKVSLVAAPVESAGTSR